jgi:hypothetical protein
MNFKEAFFDELEKIAEVDWYLDTERDRQRGSGQRYGFFTGKRRVYPPSGFVPKWRARGVNVEDIQPLLLPSENALLIAAHRKAHLRAAGYDGKPPVFTREWPLSLKQRLKHRLMSENKRRDTLDRYDADLRDLALKVKGLRSVLVHSGK